MVSDTEWLGTPEAAERLGITQRTLYRLIDEGQVPAYKMGRGAPGQSRGSGHFPRTVEGRPRKFAPSLSRSEDSQL